MAKGNPIVPVRLEDAELELLDRIISELNERRRDAPYDRSSFIRTAIKEKIEHVWRSRRNGCWRTQRGVGPDCEGGAG